MVRVSPAPEEAVGEGNHHPQKTLRFYYQIVGEKFFQQSNTLKVFSHQVRLEWWKPLFRPPKRRPVFLTWMISAFFLLDQNYKMLSKHDHRNRTGPFGNWIFANPTSNLLDLYWRIHTHLEKQVSSKHVIFYQYWVSLQPKARKIDPRTLCGQQIERPPRSKAPKW